VLQFKVGVQLATPANTALLNTSFADSTSNLSTKAQYSGSNGFVCNNGTVNCYFGNWNLIVSSPTGALVEKVADQSTVQTNAGIAYTLTYAGLGQSLTDVRMLDVLSFNGDGRTPASNSSGTLMFASLIPAPVACSACTPATMADPAIILLYTSAAPASINRDPFHVSHDIVGNGSGAGATHWCTAANFGAANCPANLAAATGFFARPVGGAALAANDVYSLKVAAIAAGDSAGDIFSNNFSLGTPSIISSPLTSSTGTVRVIAPDPSLSKTVAPTQAAPGTARLQPQRR